jgi:hypothetical protein
MDIVYQRNELPKKINSLVLRRAIASGLGLNEHDVHLSVVSAGTRTTFRVPRSDNGGSPVANNEGDVVAVEPSLTIHLPDGVEYSRNKLNGLVADHAPAKGDHEEHSDQQAREAGKLDRVLELLTDFGKRIEKLEASMVKGK